MNEFNDTKLSQPYMFSNSTTDSIFFYGLNDIKNLNLSYYNFWSNITLTKTLYVPPDKPHITSIDSINSFITICDYNIIKTPVIMDDDNYNILTTCNLENLFSTGRKILVHGYVSFTLTYINDLSDDNLFSFTCNYPFSTTISIPLHINSEDFGDTKYLKFNILTCLEKISIDSFSKESLTICDSFMIQAIPYMNHNFNSNVMKNDYCNSPFMTRENVQMNYNSSENKLDKFLINYCDNLWTEFNCDEIFEIPFAKPPIHEIVSMASSITILNSRVICDPLSRCFNYASIYTTGKRLLIHLVLHQRLSYFTFDCGSNNSLNSINFDIPISTYITVPPNIQYFDNFKLNPLILNISLFRINERQFYKNTLLFIKATQIKGVYL